MSPPRSPGFNARAFGALLFAVCVSATSALAAPPDGVSGFRMLSNDDNPPAAPSTNAGSIDGQVVAVDYKLGHVTVKAPGGQYDVVVSPSTEFRGHNDNFNTIADVRKGAHIRVLMSRRAGTYTAQIIRLL